MTLSLLNGLAAAATMIVAHLGTANDMTRDWHLCMDGGGTPDEVIQACTTVLKSDRVETGDLLPAYVHRGIAYYGKKDWEHAIQDFDEAIRIDSKNEEIFNIRGSAYRHKGDCVHALQDYDRALQLKPDYKDAIANRAIAVRFCSGKPLEQSTP